MKRTSKNEFVCYELQQTSPKFRSQTPGSTATEVMISNPINPENEIYRRVGPTTIFCKIVTACVFVSYIAHKNNFLSEFSSVYTRLTHQTSNKQRHKFDICRRSHGMRSPKTTYVHFDLVEVFYGTCTNKRKKESKKEKMRKQQL